MITIDKDLGIMPYTKERMDAWDKSADPKSEIKKFSEDDMREYVKSMSTKSKEE